MADKKKEAAGVALSAKGSHEIEIVEFCLGEKYYGINVMHVREIIRASMGIVPVSGAHPSIAGVINLRGKIIPVVNFSRHLGVHADYNLHKSRIIVSEFHQAQVGFWVHRVTRIFRIVQSQIEPPSDLVQPKGRYVTGVAKIEDRIVFLMDFEKIAADINPGDRLPQEDQGKIDVPRADFDRTAKKILIVEDSAFVRSLLVRHAREAGYNIATVGDGTEAWKILEDAVRTEEDKDISRHYHLLLTDIEMPQMDGFELIRKIRGDPRLRKLPCIVFSPTLTPELIQQCQAAGADAYLAKEGVGQLIRLMDSKVLR